MIIHKFENNDTILILHITKFHTSSVINTQHKKLNTMHVSHKTYHVYNVHNSRNIELLNEKNTYTIH